MKNKKIITFILLTAYTTTHTKMLLREIEQREELATKAYNDFQEKLHDIPYSQRPSFLERLFGSKKAAQQFMSIMMQQLNSHVTGGNPAHTTNDIPDEDLNNKNTLILK